MNESMVTSEFPTEIIEWMMPYLDIEHIKGKTILGLNVRRLNGSYSSCSSCLYTNWESQKASSVAEFVS